MFDLFHVYIFRLLQHNSEVYVANKQAVSKKLSYLGLYDTQISILKSLEKCTLYIDKFMDQLKTKKIKDPPLIIQNRKFLYPKRKDKDDKRVLTIGKKNQVEIRKQNVC